MAARGGRSRFAPLALAGVAALTVHGGGLLALYAWTPRPAAPGVTELQPVDLAPLDEAEAKELIGALGPLPGEESVTPALPALPTRAPLAARGESSLPTRVAPALPRLTDPIDTPSDEQIRVPAAQRGPAEASAEGETRPPPSGDPKPVALAPPALEPEPPDAAVPAPPEDAGRVAPALAIKVVSDTPDTPDPGHLSGGRNQADPPRDPALAIFIARMSERVRAEWHPTQVYRQINPNANFTGDVSTGGITTVEVRLRADGSLERTKVTERSGTPAIDQEALAALSRAQPFSPPPPELIDAAGGLSFPFSFGFDLTVAAFLKQLTQQIRAAWRPSPAFRRFGGWGEDRSTVVRILLKDDGTLIHASVVVSSGVDLLDNSALGALKTGTRLTAPAPGLRRRGALVPVRMVFVHALRGPDLVYAERERTKP